MSMERFNAALAADVEALRQEGRAAAPERIISGYLPPKDGFGPRYRIKGAPGEFLRMNSNSYLSLSHDVRVIAAADEAGIRYGAGPGAVRRIDGTFTPHVALEERVARFVGKSSAKIFNSAYTANLGLALAIQNERTFWIGDQLNHNCIIRAMRIARVPSEHKAIFRHNDLDDLRRCLDSIPEGIDRVVVIFDGVFSMRGDTAPVGGINEVLAPWRDRFAGGLITVVDDSHGLGAIGATGRGTVEHAGAPVDVIVGTFGKAFGVNGGFVAGSPELTEAIRQKADTYIYTNPLSAADCAAAVAAIDIADSEEGRGLLAHLNASARRFRDGLASLGLETIDGPHPVVPLLVRDTERCNRLVEDFFEREVLVVGLGFPIVPHGAEKLRFQINAAHTGRDIDQVLSILEELA
jgi:glycine C-acetyltransferase